MATAGQVRMTVGGVQVGATLTVPGNTFAQMTIPAAAWPSWAWEQRVTVQLEAKVTSGSGSIGLRGMGLWGVQS